jgi:hypothetical protein
MERNLLLADYNTFKAEALASLNETSVMLDIKAPIDPNSLADSLTDVESWGSRISYLLSKADAHLDLAEAQNLVPKSKEVTELDRQVQLKARVAEQRMIRDMLKNQLESIKNRLMLGMTNLTVVRAEIERGIGR